MRLLTLLTLIVLFTQGGLSSAQPDRAQVQSWPEQVIDALDAPLAPE